MAPLLTRLKQSLLIPPVFFLAFLGAGTLLTLNWPQPIDLPPALRWFGYALCLLYPGVAIWTLWYFRRLKTPIDPRKTATTLKVDGLYRFSRNPIYLAEMLFPVGIFLTTGSLWFLVLQPFLMLALNWFVRKIEEPRLRAALGDAYFDYQKKTRRWL